ncbi:MAG: dihydroorotase, partial [Parafilimonas sp.]
MKLLLKHAHILDSNSLHNGSVKDVLIIDGFFEKINDSITASDDMFQLHDVSVSPGWIDIFSHGCDPGIEYKETLETLAASAAAGGFTKVFTLPNTN